MATVYDIDASKLINKAAEELKSKIKEPDYTKFVKTGAGKERPPMERDWFFKRAAAILRKVYVLGPIGTNKLRVKFGNKKNRGHKPSHFYKAGGNIIRTALQELEKAGLVEKTDKKGHKGKIVTKEGRSFLDKLAK